jgi:hypothetical protein
MIRRLEMPRYIVRFREVRFMEMSVRADTYKLVFTVFKEKIANKTFTPKPDILGLTYEIETITIGQENDSQSKRIPDEYKRTNSD